MVLLKEEAASQNRKLRMRKAGKWKAGKQGDDGVRGCR